MRNAHLQLILLILGRSKLLEAGKELPVLHHYFILQTDTLVEKSQTFVPSFVPLHVSRQLAVHLQDLTQDVVAVDLDVVVAVANLDLAGHRVVDLHLGHHVVDLHLGHLVGDLHHIGVADEVKKLVDFVQEMLLYFCSLSCKQQTVSLVIVIKIV